MKSLGLLALLGLSSMMGACASDTATKLIGHGLANAANTKVGYNSTECFSLRQECQGGTYQVWQTSDGVDGCSCKM